MMKKLTAALLCFTLFFAVCAAGAETEILDHRTSGEPSAFAKDAELMEIYFPQIYGCNGALIRCGDTVIVIDACTNSGSGPQYPKLKQVIDRLGIKRIDYCINTHPDNDHIGGFFRIFREYEVGTFITGFDTKDYREPLQNKLYKLAQEQGITWQRCVNGDTLSLGELTVRFIRRFDDDKWEINNCSLCVHLDYRGRTAFFPGDIQMITQKLLQEEDCGDEIAAELINWPHHGYNKMQDKFLRRVGAKLYVITSGANDAKSAVAQLKNSGIKNYFFTSNGALRFSTDGTAWQIEYFK